MNTDNKQMTNNYGINTTIYIEPNAQCFHMLAYEPVTSSKYNFDAAVSISACTIS